MTSPAVTFAALLIAAMCAVLTVAAAMGIVR